MAKQKIKSDIELTYYDIAYSLAGAANIDPVVKLLEQFPEDLLSIKERAVRECQLQAYKESKVMPSWTFLQDRFTINSNSPIRNLGDLASTLRELQDTRVQDKIRTAVSNASALAVDASELTSMLEDAIKSNKKTDINSLSRLGSIRVEYDFLKNAPFGITSGWEIIDELTAGYQQGTVGAVAGFTSHGKSTVTNNSAYRNALLGKKVLVVSMEITKQLCHKIYLSRHSYEINKPIPYQTILRGHLDKEDEDMLFNVIEPDFLEKVVPNLLIVGTEDIPEYSERGFEQLYTMAEEVLGGLDLVIFDHVNQFLYVNNANGDTGNHYIKYITDVTKRYITKNGNMPHTTFVVQCNRGGWQQAMRKDGKYDLTALSDFNELEKSCTYVVFIYADEAMRTNREAKMQLLKHRLGQVMLEPETLMIDYAYSSVGKEFKNIIASFNPNIENDAMDAFLGGSSGMSANYDFDDLGTTQSEPQPIVDPMELASSKIGDAMKKKNVQVVDIPLNASGVNEGDFF